MRKYFLIFGLLHLLNFVIAEEIISIEEIHKRYPEIFILKKRKYKNKVLISPQLRELDPGDKLYDFVNYNQFYLTYIFSKTIRKNNGFKHLKEFKGDSLELQKKFINLIIKDTTFSPVFEKYICHYYNSIGYKVKGFKKIKNEISKRRLKDIAVKFFYIKDIKENGEYIRKLCVKDNGIDETEKNRNLHIEAFCFDAFADSVQKFIEIFDEVTNKIEINLGLNKKEELLRTQGAVYYATSRNSKVMEILKDEYLRKKSYLPFKIKEWE